MLRKILASSILALALIATPTLARDGGHDGGRGGGGNIGHGGGNIGHSAPAFHGGGSGPAFHRDGGGAWHGGNVNVQRRAIQNQGFHRDTYRRDLHRGFVQGRHFHSGRVFFHGRFWDVGVGPCWRLTPLGWIWICDPYDYYY